MKNASRDQLSFYKLMSLVGAFKHLYCTTWGEKLIIILKLNQEFIFQKLQSTRRNIKRTYSDTFSRFLKSHLRVPTIFEFLSPRNLQRRPELSNQQISPHWVARDMCYCQTQSLLKMSKLIPTVRIWSGMWLLLPKHHLLLQCFIQVVFSNES